MTKATKKKYKKQLTSTKETREKLGQQ